MSSTVAVGIDLGGTWVRAALLDHEGRVAVRASEATDRGGPQKVVRQMRGLVAKLCTVTPLDEITRIGVAAPGPLDSDAGVVLEIPTLPGWHDVPLQRLVEEAFGKPTVLENDGVAAAYGEWRFGAGRGLRHLVYLTVSTGLGGGVVMDGRLLHGRRGMGAHVGHMVLAADGPECSCGASGCFEAFASGSALGREGRRAARAHPESLLAAQRPPEALTGREVVACARSGDPVALEVLAREARHLGNGIAGLIHLYSPERVVVGGGVVGAFDLLYTDLWATVQARVMPPFREVAVVPSALGDNAGLVGAAALALHGESLAFLNAGGDGDVFGTV